MRVDLFTTLGAFLDNVSSLPRGATSYRWNRMSGDATPEQAVDLARLGWAEGARRASALAARIADRVVRDQTTEGVEPEVSYDVTGASYDVGSYLSGEPECWTVFEPTETKRAIRLVANIGASAGVNADAMMKRGTAMAALAIALQAKGHPVTVDVCDCGVYDGTPTAVVVRVADASSGSPLDIDRLVFALAHPAMLRHLIRARVDGTLGGEGRDVWGPAQPQDWKPECDLYVGCAHLNQAERWADGGEAWVLAEFERQTSGS